MSTVKNNVIFNYIGRIYVSLVGILIFPLYLRHLGAEGYGLVGFFTLLQGGMQLLDLGLSPTLSREVARLRTLPSRASQLRTIVRSLELIFVVIAVLTTVPLFLARHWIATNWLSIQDLNLGLVSTCIGIMTLMLGIRWLAALHRSGINAYEQQVWMNVTNIIFATLRFPGSLLLIIATDGDLLVFFAYQLILAVIEQMTITLKFHRLLPKTKQAIAWFSTEEVRRIAPFALSVGYTGGVGIFIGQLDKLVLSKVLPLAQYGYYTLVVSVAAGIMTLAWPVSTAILPRLTALLYSNSQTEMLALYCKSTRFVVCIIAPITLVLAFFPRQVIYIWTGDATAADWVAPILPLFVLASGLLAIAAFQYYLQYAYGQLKLHVQSNTVLAALSTPAVIYAAFTYGPIGVGYVWVGLNLIALLFWTPYVHKVFAPGLHLNWLLKDVVPPIGITVLLVAMPVYLLKNHFPDDRLYGLLVIASTTAFVTAITLAASFNSEIRSYQHEKFQLR